MTALRRHRDPNTLSNYTHFTTTHTSANLTIDFDRQILHGNVTSKLTRFGPDKTLILDSSFVKVHSVHLNSSPAKWTLGPRTEPYGAALSIEVADTIKKGDEFTLQIDLETTNECTAIQWLSKEQTSNKKYPYMFSQCQAIHARSIFPCQDTPDVKATFDFNISSPLPVFGSGLPVDVPEKHTLGEVKTYRLEQKVPIPSYLFALASGDIATAKIGSRSVVATGPEDLAAAKWELENDMERFIEAAESIIKGVPYTWGQYNVLVLPPSFPYGGMENPVFTFATPTIIAGDRANIDVVAHELSHSWSGNLVSTCSWEHFWLNEGWTVYLERRILEAIHGPAHFHFSALIGWSALTGSIENYGADHRFTRLVPPLENEDPDDAFSSVPYEKGFTFLFYLDNLVGREKWNKFIPHYFSTFARRSLETDEFKATLLDFFASDAEASKKLASVDWDTWFYSPGLPPKPTFDTSLADSCYALAKKWQGKSKEFTPSKEDVKDFSSGQVILFLDAILALEKPLSIHDAQLLGATYGLTSSTNVEIQSRYLRAGLAAVASSSQSTSDTTTTSSPRKPFTTEMADLLGRIGRMKFVRPGYRALMAVDMPFAKDVFKQHEGFYHPICRAMVKGDFEGKPGGT